MVRERAELWLLTRKAAFFCVKVSILMTGLMSYILLIQLLSGQLWFELRNVQKNSAYDIQVDFNLQLP